MCKSCGRKKPNLMLARAIRSNPADTVTVSWQVQPEGVTIYVASSGRRYKVRNIHENVVINRADRPEFERLGYVPKEQ